MSYKSDVKQGGKRQAMTNTFLRLNTRPEEYEPNADECGYGLSHCELCGNKIDYNFKLTHPKDLNFNNGRSLRIGSDCLISFTEVFMPSRIQQFVDRVSKSVEKAKVKKFKEENPEVFQKFKEFEEVMKGYDRQYPWNPLKRLKVTAEIYRNHRHLVRHQYLSKPKISQMLKFLEEIKTYENHLVAWTERTKFHKGEDTMLVASQKDPDFYYDINFYGKALGFDYKDAAVAYTYLEKLLFYDQLETLKEDREKRKQAFLKELEARPTLYGRIFNLGVESNYWSLLIKYRPIFSYTIHPLLKDKESPEVLYNAKDAVKIKNPWAKDFLKQLKGTI